MQTPFKPIDFLSRDVAVERRGDGTILLQSNHPLKPYETHVPAFLAKWARRSAGPGWPAAAPRRGPRVAETHLRRGQAAGRCGDPGADRSRLRPGQAGDDPVLELHRVRTAHHGGHAGPRTLAPVSPAYLGDEPGPRQAALRLRPHQAGHGVRAERRDLRPRPGRARISRACCWCMSTRRRRRCSRCPGASLSPPRRPMPSRARSSRSTPRRRASSCSPRAAPACPRPSSTPRR